MTYDRKDFERLIREKSKQRLEEMLPQLHLLRQGSVAAEILPGVPAWDTFLRYIQGAIETTEYQLATLQAALGSPDVLDQAQLLRIKVDALRCSERIQAWKAIIQLPKDLIEQGENAQGLLSRMERIDVDDRGSSSED